MVTETRDETVPDVIVVNIPHSSTQQLQLQFHLISPAIHIRGWIFVVESIDTKKMTSLRLTLSTLRLTPRLAKPLPSQSRVLRASVTSIHRRPLSTHPLRLPTLATFPTLKESPPSTRPFSTGKSQADLIVEELQELYSFLPSPPLSVQER